jgi:hypothetical protein
MSTLQTIQMDVQSILSFIDKILPTVETAVPAIASLGGPIGVGLSAAEGIVSLLGKIPIGPVYTVEVQASYLQRVQALTLLDFSGPQWKPSSGVPATAPASSGAPGS